MQPRKVTEHLFPLARAQAGRYLVDRNGQPFLVQGEAAWSLVVQLSREEVLQYLEDRRRRGFNLLMVNLLEHHFSDHPPSNRYGQAPFTRPNDFTTPNEPYFSHVDWVLRQAEAFGFAVLLCPTYLGYDGGDEGWYQEIVKNGAPAMREFGRYVGERYKVFPNIIWLEGGDYRPPDEHLDLVNAVAEGIRERGATQLHSAHWAPEVSASDVKVSGWLDFNTTYTYGVVYEKSLHDYRRELPHLMIESKYENEEGWTPQRLRAQAYYALLTGSFGQVFGNSPIWKFGAGWQAALASPGSVSMTHVRALFEPRRWTDLVPDDRQQVLVGGQGDRGSPDYALLARDKAGALAIAYLPKLRPLEIDLSRLDSGAHARWYDPTNGQFTDARGAGTRERSKFEPPGKNSAGDEDWVLVFESATP